MNFLITYSSVKPYFKLAEVFDSGLTSINEYQSLYIPPIDTQVKDSAYLPIQGHEINALSAPATYAIRSGRGFEQHWANTF